MSTIKHSQISALLVDDDAKLCGLLRDYLEGFGFSLDVGWKKPLRTNTT